MKNLSMTVKMAVIVGAVLTMAATEGLSTIALAAGSPDRAVATSAIALVTQDPNRAAAAADSISQAKAALERATALRETGDEAHALLADGLARDWAEAAADLGSTLEAEEKAAVEQRSSLEAAAAVERERSLLEEALARVGRLRVQLENLAKRSTTGAPTKTGAAKPSTQPGKP